MSFTKDSLKDWMVVTLRGGLTGVVNLSCNAIIFENGFYALEELTKELLDKDGETHLDIVKVHAPVSYVTEGDPLIHGIYKKEELLFAEDCEDVDNIKEVKEAYDKTIDDVGETIKLLCTQLNQLRDEIREATK